VKHYSLFKIFSLLSISAIIYTGCKKINEATELGAGLIPAVDNITTFEQYLEVESDSKLLLDTTEVLFNDLQAVGHITADPEFGATHADGYFDISAPAYGVYPFFNKDSIVNNVVDSVVLSLRCDLHYGDSNSMQTLRVFEIAQNSGFSDTSLNRYNRPDILTFGPQLGFKTFRANSYRDSVRLYRRFNDTTSVSNVIRIRLNNSFGNRLVNYDTTSSILTGAYKNDSLFKTFFRGLAIKADNSGNALNYIEPSNTSGSGLIVYYRVKRPGGIIDTTSVSFFHDNSTTGIGGQANIIRKTPAAAWASYLANSNPADDKVYITSLPGGYASLKIPALNSFPNSVIHLAELIVTPIPSIEQSKFVHPGVLFLDGVNNANDTAFTFDNDMLIPPFIQVGNFAYDAARYGGFIKRDSTYRFNISRHVQSIITQKKRNLPLRLYAPVRADVFSPVRNQFAAMFVGNAPGYGRVVLAGGNYADAPKRLRLRIVYSKI
jgi:hypothetical protein